jgi:hypothetical protein
MNARRLLRLGFIALAFPIAASASAEEPRPSAEACASTAERGMDARAEGRLSDALEAFRACAVDVCPDIVKADCRVALAELSTKAPRISVRVRVGAEADVADAEVEIDGERVPPAERATGLVLNAGQHTLTARRGGRTATRTFVVTNGDQSRTVEIEIPSNGPERAPEPEAEVNLLPAAVVGGAALASLGVAAVLGVWSYVDFRDYEDGCSPRCDEDDVAASQARAVGADVALGIGLNLVVAATVLFFAGPKVEPAPRGIALRF